MNTKLTPFAVSLLFVTGCVTLPEIPPYADATDHYRASERFRRVTIDVRAGPVPATSEPAEWRVPAQVAEALAEYLRREGLEVVGPDDPKAVRFDITVHAAPTPRGRWGEPPGVWSGLRYTLDARLLEPDGAVIEATKLYHEAGESSPAATGQQLASLAADDLLLIWHPQPAVVGEDYVRYKPAAFGLLMDPAGPPVDGDYRLSWEAFPSMRLLAGADFSAADVSEVTYELRLHRPIQPGHYSEGRLFQVRVHFIGDVDYEDVATNATHKIYRIEGLTEPGYTFDVPLPACTWVVWSVRAHFRLHGVPRVTEWSGDYSTKMGAKNSKTIVPPYFYRRGDYTASRIAAGKLEHHTGGGSMIRVDPPAPLTCEDLKSPGSADVGDLRIEPIAPGQSIAVIATDAGLCAGEDCAVETSLSEASGTIASCLASEFERSGIDIPVEDLSGMLGELPSGTGKASAVLGNAALMDALQLEENRAYLEARRIRYLVSTDMSYDRTGRTWGESSIVAMESSVEYASTMQTHIIDVRAGKVVGSISSSARGTEGKVVPILLVIPLGVIDYGSRAKVDAKACDAMARRLSFVLRGGASGWPEFVDVFGPLWEND